MDYVYLSLNDLFQCPLKSFQFHLLINSYFQEFPRLQSFIPCSQALLSSLVSRFILQAWYYRCNNPLIQRWRQGGSKEQQNHYGEQLGGQALRKAFGKENMQMGKNGKNYGSLASKVSAQTLNDRPSCDPYGRDRRAKGKAKHFIIALQTSKRHSYC